MTHPVFPAAEIQEPVRTAKAQKKRGLKAASPGEVKPSGAPGRRKTKLDRSQKSLRMKPSLEVTGPRPLASSILTQVLGRGRFRKVGDSLSLQAGEPLELRCRGKVVHWRVPAYLEEEGKGRLRYGMENSHGSLNGSRGGSEDAGQHFINTLTIF